MTPKDKLHLGLGEIVERHPLPWSHHVLMIKDANGRQVIHLGGLRQDSGRPYDPYFLAGLAALLVEHVNESHHKHRSREFFDSGFAKRHHLDVDFEVARSLHRVVRALNDGECPKCHALSDSTKMRDDRSLTKQPLTCPNCGFSISLEEEAAAIQTFAPVMERNLDVFEEWRKTL